MKIVTTEIYFCFSCGILSPLCIIHHDTAQHSSIAQYTRRRQSFRKIDAFWVSFFSSLNEHIPGIVVEWQKTTGRQRQHLTNENSPHCMCLYLDTDTKKSTSRRNMLKHNNFDTVCVQMLKPQFRYIESSILLSIE